MSPPLLDVRDLSVRFPTPSGPIEAVSGVSFTVYPGETLAVVGESGSGKSVSSLAVLGLLGGGRATGGSIRFQGEELVGADPERLRRLRGAEIAMIFQNPMSSLDPLFTVGDQIAEALRIHRAVSRREARDRAVELLTEVGLPDPARRVRSYPHELSGGQQQRVMIAMALACEPALLIADEPTTALDVTVEAQILELLRRMQRDHGTALLFVTHDMGVVAEMADRVLVMYAGKVVEQGAVDEVLRDPRNPYTRALIESIPTPSTPRDLPMPAIAGNVPHPSDLPGGCRFHPRCRSAMDRCGTDEPPLVDLGSGRTSRCWQHEPASEVARVG
ncbi:peptide/nickel transport system ATP-binding protein/oligopeptide transport system ATP-binding protein [Pseudonocardia hierapolitana]|uniref:Peptide/nickel transport system ATP-binding protein/oligopeptide transport system ATP-binding protein n=1 Tax=Pseudonocardia hierapolitana TaxID=1128676 RepID=A0A561T157_9PSEU|nr:ABC transporter ATP-binding protein [Pseudonocardia hierapolitana]TWF80825.1 peptide/nickel transport system ATP-binding protein/oligopeptide transport system ATP-binding protein [Pseudonocardia hierapolitana]